ncbi:MAG: DegT/DnrJ/EryC1/StrS family aminotransferase [Armatimonadota bacterium]|nr:DegT/DnrJ/EryC1/StrS family aminotransferase [Armatimonadota bacterium]MDR7532724.1 DegT/DnrJ/EryC1/StrS family aminotransferase [Armatimonadota bacterium]MDR7535344.1 DegT/DnrJ/EryC1/StrS family aminotransferase [Armatimonadota bacterium]
MTARAAAAIPIARPQIGDEEAQQVVEVLRSGMLVAGRRVAEFEQAFARYTGASYAVATSSGSAALHVALQALGLGPGDRVVTSPFSFGATSHAVLHVGAEPVFADVDPATGNLDPNTVEPLLRRGGIRAILVVHLYGLPADVPAFEDLARRHGVLLIEDCAQAHGAAVAGRRVGTFGDAAVFSFYPTKNMTTGEGGMLLARTPEVARRARLLVDPRGDEEYAYEVVGHNFRMTEMAAAMGLVQLRHLDVRNAARRANARHLTDGLADLGWLRVPVEPAGYHHVYHQYTIQVPSARDALARHLTAAGVGTRVYYPRLIPDTPAYRRRGLGGVFPHAQRLTREVLSLPVHPGLSADDVATVVAAVRAFPGAAA